uniref:Uncharacterized protein n=1 Tax=Romanomermis culicivorax TaxID=13658 RepID=A0A915KSY7_ROMCU
MVGELRLQMRTLAMLVKNINAVVTKAEKSRNSASESWSNTKLRWYINKFYRSLDNYHALKGDNADVVSQENAVMVIFYVCHLKIAAPFDEQHLQNIALLLYEFFLSPDNTGNSSDRYLTQLIRLSKLITICNQWDIDIGKILEHSCEKFNDTATNGHQKLDASKIWSDIFHQVADLYSRTKKPGVLINDFRLNVLTNCLSLACKFGQESNFVRNLKSTWLENLALNVFNKTQLEEMIVRPLQQNERLARKAEKYNSHGCFANLFKILDTK